MSQPLAERTHLPPATEQQVRDHAAQLIGLAARHGITGLAFASPGRLHGHVATDRDPFDVFEFQRATTGLLGAEVALYSDGALRGLGLVFLNSVWTSTMQVLIPDQARSRVDSYDWLVSLVVMPAGYAIIGPLAAAAATEPC